MHVKRNRTLATVALTLPIVTLSGVLYGAWAAWSALHEFQQGLAELGSTLGGDTPAVTELPSSGETQTEWYVNEQGESCYEVAETNETICEPPIPD